MPRAVPSTSEKSGAPVGGPPSFVVGAEERALVLAARRARRRLRAAWRVARKLLVVGFFIAVVAAIMVPSATGLGCRGKQSEAKGNLMGLFSAMTAYFGERDVFTDDLEKIGFDPRLKRYRFVLTDVVNFPQGPFAFVGWAFADPALDPELAGDVWRIDQKRDLVQVADGCSE